MAPTGSCLGMILVKLHRIAKYHYNFKSEFETRKEKMVDQDFGHQNDPMSRPNLDWTPLGTNTTNGTTPPIDSIPVGTKTPNPTPLTQPTEFPEQNGISHVSGDPDPDPSFSDSSSKSLILRMIAVLVNQRKRNAIRRKII